jgi:alcohol dehydrogenase class IV
VMLPYVVAFNADTARAELSPMADLVEGDLAPALRRFVAELGLPTSVAETGIPRREIGAAARLALRSSVPNPRAVDVAQLERLLRAAYDGHLPD